METSSAEIGQLVCKAVGVIGTQTDLVEQLCDLIVLFFIGQLEVDVHALRDNLSDGHTRVQRSIWVLEDNLDVLAELQQVFSLQGGDVLAVKDNLAGGRFIQLHHSSAAGGFSAAGLAYQTQCFAAFDGHADVVHRFQSLFATCFKEFAQVCDLHDGVGILQFFDYLVHYFASLS